MRSTIENHSVQIIDGRRSKEASVKLAALGYTNIIEIGGILDWDGEIEVGVFE